MVDTSNGNGAMQDRMQKVAQSATFTVLARLAMILWAAVGGPVAVWALIAGVGLAVDLRDGIRDMKRDVGQHDKAIDALQLEDQRQAIRLQSANERIQGLEYKINNTGR